MKTSTPQLRALIESGQFIRADLYTITFTDGSIVHFTSADKTLKWNGITYPHSFLNVDRESVTQTLGLEVQSLNMNIYPENQVVAGVNIRVGLRRGFWDNAWILIQKAYIADRLSQPTGVVHAFEGIVYQVEGGGIEYNIEIKSGLTLLEKPAPSTVFQGTCKHVVYDSGCQLLRSSFTSTNAAEADGNYTYLPSTLSQPDGYFDLGVLRFTSGLNEGVRRTVKKYVGGGITFNLPLVNEVKAGDQFLVYPGCDRLDTTCKVKFNNSQHFKGYPFVPAQETVY